MTSLPKNEIEEKLNTVSRLRIFFNTNKELSEFVGFQVSGNNSLSKIGGNNRFIKRAVYERLCNYAKNFADIDFDKFLAEYKQSSDYYTANKLGGILPKKHCKACVGLIKFIYGNEAEYADEDAAGENDFFTIAGGIKEASEKREVNVLIIIMLALKLLPLYDKGRGDVKDIRKDFKTLLDFLEAPMKDNAIYGYNPTLERCRNYMEEEDFEPNRMLLYSMFKDILDNHRRCTSNEVLYSTNMDLQNKKVFRIEDGSIWKANDNDYWYFSTCSNGYMVTRYLVKRKRQRIECICYEGMMYMEDDLLCLTLIDPRGSLRLPRGKMLRDTDIESFDVETVQGPQGEECLRFTPISEKHWLDLEQLVKTDMTLQDLDRLFGNYESYNKYPETEYTITQALAAITENHLYLSTGDGSFYRIPKSRYPLLSKVSFDDIAGIVELSYYREKILGFIPQGIFINVSTEENCAMNGVEITDSIT